MNNLHEKILLNRTEAAEFVGLSRRTLYGWAKDGMGPTVIHGPNGLPYYARKVLEAPESWNFQSASQAA